MQMHYFSSNLKFESYEQKAENCKEFKKRLSSIVLKLKWI